jgi:hypothetical protein
MRLATSLSPADLAGEEGLLGLAVENLFQPGGIGEEVEWAPPFLPHEEKRSGRCSEEECGGGAVIAGSS